MTSINIEQNHITQLIAKKTEAHIRFIIKQANRFASMPINERISYLKKNPNDFFCRIPLNEENRYLDCGIDAWNKLGDLADIALNIDKSLCMRISRQLSRDTLTKVFVKLFIQENIEITRQSAILLLEETVESLRQSLIMTEHYLPCILFTGSNVNEISIGPVTFFRKNKFFKNKGIRKSRLMKGVSTRRPKVVG